METTRVVIVGGTGYLGQHLLQAFTAGNNGVDRYDVAFTHHSSPLPRIFPQIPSFPVDLKSGLGFSSISQNFGQPDVVVNCAALSVPRVCEQDPDSAMSINVPCSLVNWLSTLERNKTLLIHLSTDQVYEGVKSFYKEEDDTVPVNVYGKSKVEAELLIKEKCRNFAILRSRLSRVQMGELVAQVRGHDPSLIKPVSASSVDRGVVSPADISMDISKLIQTLKITPTSFKDGVRLTFEF